MKRSRSGILSIPLLALVVTGAAAAPAAAQQDTLTLSLAEALRLARDGNPGFLAARNDEDEADWAVREAYGSLLPSASFGGSLQWQGAGEQRFGSLTLAQNQPAYYLSSYDVGLSYALDGGRLLAPAAARARRTATVAQIHAAEVSLQAAVTRAYLEVLRRAEGEVLAAQQLERARFNLRLARRQQEVGTVTPLDARRAEVQVGRAEVALLQAANARATAGLRLLQQIGSDADRPLVLTTTFALEEPTWQRDALLALALERNQTLAARRATLDAGSVQVRQARSAYLPTLSARAGLSGFTREASSTTSLIQQAQSGVGQLVQSCVLFNDIYRRLATPLPTNDCSALRFTDEQRNRIVADNSAFPFGFSRQPASASLSLSLPVFQGLGRERQLEAAKVQREDADLQLREQRIALAVDLSIGLRAVTTAYRSAVLEEHNRAVADEQLRLAGERYRVGAISIVDLVDAETVKAEADQAYVNAVFAYHDAVAELEAVVGSELR
ncbi:MAG: TolC family protein [Gemmatimonadetes bacterium]|nr:TolC family protein [Gemmatimonadota bacterium]